MFVPEAPQIGRWWFERTRFHRECLARDPHRPVWSRAWFDAVWTGERMLPDRRTSASQGPHPHPRRHYCFRLSRRTPRSRNMSQGRPPASCADIQTAETRQSAASSVPNRVNWNAFALMTVLGNWSWPLLTTHYKKNRKKRRRRRRRQ